MKRIYPDILFFVKTIQKANVFKKFFNKEKMVMTERDLKRRLPVVCGFLRLERAIKTK